MIASINIASNSIITTAIRVAAAVEATTTARRRRRIEKRIKSMRNDYESINNNNKVNGSTSPKATGSTLLHQTHAGATTGTPSIGSGSTSSNATAKYKVYKIRYLQLFLYGMGSFVNGMIWISFASITDEAAVYYDLYRTDINYLSLIFMLLYIPGSFLSNWIFSQYQLRYSIIIACTLDAIGTTMRYCSTLWGSSIDQDISPSASLSSSSSNTFDLDATSLALSTSTHAAMASSSSMWFIPDTISRYSRPSLIFLFFGQSLCAIAQPIFTNSEAKIGAVWFASDERGLATTIGSMLNMLGSAVGNYWPSIVVYKDAEGIHGINSLLLGQAILANAVALSVYLLFMDKPPTPPSASQIAAASSPRLQHSNQAKEFHSDVKRGIANLPSSYAIQLMMQDIQECLSNRQFVLLCLCFGIGMGVFTAMNTLVQQLVAPSGYDSNDAGYFGTCTLVFGVISSFFVAMFLDRTHMYNPLVRAGNYLAVLSFYYLGKLLFEPKDSHMVALGFSIVGSIMTPLIPVSFESGAECTYPVSEEVSTGLLMSSGQIFGIIFTLIIGNELETNEILGVTQDQYLKGYNFYGLEHILPKLPAGFGFMIYSLCLCCFLAYQYQGKYNRLEADALDTEDYLLPKASQSTPARPNKLKIFSV